MDTQVGVLIWGLWEIQTGAIINVIFRASYAETYIKEPIDELLSHWEKEKKDKQGKHCHKQRKHFSKFFLSMYGMLGKESLVVLMNFSQLVAEKLR